MTAKIITTFNQKGGVGKSTLTMHLAGELSIRGYAVLVADLDPQATASRWSGDADESNPFPAHVVSLAGHGAKFRGEIRKLTEDFDVILMDCPPNMREIPSIALAISDMALVPMIPSPGEVHSLEATKLLVKAAREDGNPSLIARMVINRSPRTGLARTTAAFLRKSVDLPVLDGELSDLAAFADAQSRGAIAAQMQRADKAVAQIGAIADQILELLGIPRDTGEPATDTEQPSIPRDTAEVAEAL